MQQNRTDAPRTAPSSPTTEAIRAYQTDTLREKLHCGQEHCPRCGAARGAEPFFRRHAVRDRSLRVIIERLAYRIEVRLIRWRCPLCRRTFTDYPPFMLPYKHYALPDMQARAARYVTNDDMSYRRGVRESTLPIFHADAPVAGVDSSEEEKDFEATPVLAHTTLYRWVTTLGRTALQPAESDTTVARWKYWTLDRGSLLLALLSFTRTPVRVETL